MELGVILFAIGMILGIVFILAMCVRIILDMLDFNVPSEDKFISAFIKIAIVYAVVVFVYFMGLLVK